MQIETYQIIAAVNCRANDGVIFVQASKGLINNAAGEVRKIAGCHTREIEAILGSKEYDEVIHRNNLALVE